MSRHLFLLLTASVLLLASRAEAQSYSMTARSFVQSPSVVAMGDAGVAFVTTETAFFYNPAHIAQVAAGRPHITFLGVTARASDGLTDWYDFYQDDLSPALDEGVENMSGQERQDLYDRAFEIARRRESVNADVLLPSVAFRLGPVGVGAGLFTDVNTQMQITDAGGGVPHIDVRGQADLMGLATAGVQVAGLSVGATAKYGRRYMTLKSKPLDAFAEEEAVYLLRGDRLGFDVGATYTLSFVPVPGRLTAGAALFDVFGNDYEYEVDRSFNEAGESAQVEAEEVALANALQVSPSYRVGVAYQVPSLFGVFRETGVALDYIGYDEPFIRDQPFLAHLHMGAQVRLAKLLAVRGGLSQGYPTAGAGLYLGPVRADYAYFGQEEGRLPGQNASWHHQVRLVFGLF